MGAGGSGPEWLVFAAGLLDRRAAATFVVLAGVGILLMMNKARLEANVHQTLTHRKTLLKRALFLFVVGLLDTPLWPADILHFYGLYIAIAVMFLTLRVRSLVAIACTLIFVFAVLVFVLAYEQGWNWETLQYSGFWTIDDMFGHICFSGVPSCSSVVGLHAYWYGGGAVQFRQSIHLSSVAFQHRVF